MTITSAGYSGTIDELQWAQIAAHIGSVFPVVVGDTDLKVTPVAGQDRTVSVAAGVAVGHGVMDTLSPAQSIQLPVVASGSRWDAVCLRRDWTTNETVLVSVDGTATQQLPASLLDDPGTEDDQPLALIRVTAGQQLPTGVVDLRLQGSKQMMCSALIALPDAPYGTQALVNGVPYVRGLDGGNLAWFRLEGLGTAMLTVIEGQDYSLSGLVYHGLGVSTSNIQLTPIVDGTAALSVSVQAGSKTATTFRIQLRRVDNAFAETGSVFVDWSAKRYLT